jgi:hypothetical protein
MWHTIYYKELWDLLQAQICAVKLVAVHEDTTEVVAECRRNGVLFGARNPNRCTASEDVLPR